MLVIARHWDPADEKRDREYYFGVEAEDEVTGHYCEECNRLVSLSLNTLEQKTQ